MHTLLQKLLEKRQVGIKDLKEDEKQTFDTWNATLTGEAVTVAKIEDFCRRQIDAIEGKWDDVNNKQMKNERLMYQHAIYSKILRLITAEERERERLEKYLTDLIDMDTGPTL